MTHTYQWSRADRRFTVGYYDPQGLWHAMSDHPNSDEAAAEVARLNGGTHLDLDAVAAKVAELLAQRQHLDAATATLVQAGDANELHQAREMMRDLLAKWDALNVYGFACGNADATAPFLKAIVDVREHLRSIG